MATMNISLPDQMKTWVEDQATAGRYSNSSDYVRDLIRRDQQRLDKVAAMQLALTQGLDSGISEQSFDQIIAAAREQARAAGRADGI